MATFKISITNETYASFNDYEARTLEDATAHALKAALQIGADEVAVGTQFFGAEIRIQCEDEEVKRLVVSVGASQLRCRADATND